MKRAAAKSRATARGLARGCRLLGVPFAVPITAPFVLGLVAVRCEAFAFQDGAPPSAAPTIVVEDPVRRSASVGVGAASAADAATVEFEAVLDIAVEPFDPAAWQRRLAIVDLDRRERAYERLRAILPHSPDAQAWVRAEARRGEGELAWTCRMLLRSEGRSSAESSGSTGAPELFVWRGNDDRVLLGGSGPSLRAGGRAIDVVIVEPRSSEARRVEFEARRALRGATLEEFVPLPPGAASTPLRFEVAITSRADDGAPLTTWRVLDTTSLEGLVIERASPADFGGVSTGELPASLDRGERAGAFVLERLAPQSNADGARRNARASMERLGVFVDAEADGLVVLDVEPGSVAHALGVARGDRLDAIDGVTLARPDDITVRLRAAAPQGSVSVRWRRAGDGLVIERRYVAPRIVLEPRAADAPEADVTSQPPAPTKD
jgi:hypothetical protein